MHYTAIAETDLGISKKSNQDSLLIKHGRFDGGEVLLAIVCDGMGGLDKGEVASATVIKAFSEWFDRELPFELNHPDMRVIAGKWSLLLKELNIRILEYGAKEGIKLGTTFTGVLFIDWEYIVAHVGDSRFYSIGHTLKQLTTDQTFVAREVARGNMTAEQGRTDKRRNLLLQCVGASDEIDPETFIGEVSRGAYLLCSDGFRHEVSDQEIFESFNPVNLVNKEIMHSKARYLIEQNKSRMEKDNISVLLIKAD